MEELQLGSFLIPILVALGLLAFFASIIIWSKRYVKVPPDQVAVITGRKRILKDAQGRPERTVGYRIVRGGATFVWPLLENVNHLSLRLITIPVSVEKAYNADGVPVSIDAVANIKIKGEDQSIANAVERFLGNPGAIENTVRQTLEGHLRSIVGRMTVEQLNSDRKTFAQTLTEESVVDLEKMGIGSDSIVIKKIQDEHGYLEALGVRRTAEVKKDAEIGKAEAEAESKKKTTDAEREAAEIATENQRKIAEAQKSLDVKKAGFDAEVARERASAEQAGPLAKAEAEKAVLVAQQDAKAAQTTAATQVQIAEAERRGQELEATVIKQAEADKQAAIIKSEAEAATRIRLAEAGQQAAEMEAQATAIKIIREGEAQASATKAKLLAEAEGNKARLVAEADGQRAKLLAEAEGKEKLAEALKKLNEAGQLLFLMEKSPEVIKAIGEAGGEVARGIFQSLAAPLGSIDTLSVYDSGGGSNGTSATNRVAELVPNMFFNFLQQCRANGVELGTLVENLVTAVNRKLQVSSDGSPAITSPVEEVTQ